MSLESKHILLGVGGGIAAFKAVELARELGRRRAEVQVVMTQAATRFIGPTTFSGLTGRAAVTDLWDPAHPGEVHVELGQWADLVVVAPATANLLSRAASGMADDALLATLSCATCPVLYAPAMHERMWLAAATQRNVARLEADGARFVGPVQGALASGGTGWGRMSEPSAIADAVEHALATTRDLDGKTVLVSAGPTHEDIDPVRYLGNRSTGRMGYAVAAVAHERGARVILVSGPTAIEPPAGVEVVRVRSAREMHAAITGRVAEADAVVMTAAVADYRPVRVAKTKIKKDADTLRIELVKNPDILAELGATRRGKRPVLVGFAMETHDVIAHARKKLADKRVDLVVANEAAVGFGRDDTQATLVSPDGDEVLPAESKRALAARILDRIAALLPAAATTATTRNRATRSRPVRRPGARRPGPRR